MAKTASTRIVRLPFGKLEQGILSDVNPIGAPLGSCVAYPTWDTTVGLGTTNVVWVDGLLRSRPGFQTIAYLPPALSGWRVHKLMVHQDRIGGNYPCAIALDPVTGVGAFVQWAPDFSTSVVVPLPITIGQLSATTPITSGNFSGVTYFTTGPGDIWYYDPQDYLGSGVVLGVLNTLQPASSFQAPTAVQLLVSGDPRLIIANFTPVGGTPVPYGIDWSAFTDPKTWGGAISNQGGDSGGTALPKNSDPITGLYVNSSVLTIFRPREIYIGVEVGSPAEYIVSCFDQGPGCVAHATIQPYRDGAIVWLGDDNVYIGAPGQQPQPLGDHIRLRIRKVASLANLGQAKALLDYDHQLYTLFLPDINTGLVTKMFTCNLRNGGWWEGDLADPTMHITDAIAYRYSSWQTFNVVGTDDGRVLQYRLDYTQDDQTPFPCSWTSSILSVRNSFPGQSYFGPEHEQASVQTLRIIGQLANPSPLESVTFQLNHGNGIDHMVAEPFTPDQALTGDPNTLLFSYGRVTNEFFQINIGATSATQFPLVAAIEIGAIGQGMTK